MKNDNLKLKNGVFAFLNFTFCTVILIFDF
jgi:hypothetical protein